MEVFKVSWKLVGRHDDFHDLERTRFFRCFMVAMERVLSFAILVLGAAQLLLVIPHVDSTGCVYEECSKQWEKKGCRHDYHRSMTALLDYSKPDSPCKIDWDRYDEFLHHLACKCRQAAIDAGNKWFALEYYGICYSAKGNLSSYLEQYPLDANHSCIGVMKHNKTIVSDIDGEICVGGYARAFFYNITDFDAQAAPAAAEAEEEEEIIQCTKVSDVIIMIDSSSSVGDSNFKLVLEFLQKFMDAYDFSSGKSRLGIVTFDEHCYVDLTWMDSSGMSISEIRNVINGLRYTKGSTLTDNALLCARDKIIKLSQRPNVPKTIIVMTDGRSWDGYNRLPGPSIELRGMGCKMLAIGVGNGVDPEELRIITGNPTQIFLLESYRNLIDYAAKNVNSLLTKACAP